MNYVLIVINALLATSGQLLFKKSADFLKAHPDSSFPMSYLSNPWFFAAVSLFVLSTFVWTQVLTKMPLSIAYPIASLAYVLTVFGAYIFFDERITSLGIIGVLMIVGGVTLTALSH